MFTGWDISRKKRKTCPKTSGCFGSNYYALMLNENKEGDVAEVADAADLKSVETNSWEFKSLHPHTQGKDMSIIYGLQLLANFAGITMFCFLFGCSAWLLLYAVGLPLSEDILPLIAGLLGSALLRLTCEFLLDYLEE
jgi:hypothetical protein